ncbi:MAG: RluA family pseudouridine synthase [Bacilli bacterium]|nr:RluA family pseudouridine synthase [Bacilli bacterium]MBN2697006.1 RluA family pseudouridine synthase [Bacilli bacterium]
MKLKIVYEDTNILIVDKPVGILSHPAQHHQGKDLLTELENKAYAVITRLDFNTPGLVLLAKNAFVAANLNKLQELGKIRKYYQVLVKGYMPKQEDVLVAYLLKDERKGISRISANPIPKAQKIVTAYSVIDEHNGLTLLEVELITGRMHQIRAHLAHLTHPVIGDPLYGDLKTNKQFRLENQALAAMRIVFDLDKANPFALELPKLEFIKPDFPYLYLLKEQ